MSQNDDNRRMLLAQAMQTAVNKASPASTVSDVATEQAYQQHLMDSAENGQTPLSRAQFQAQQLQK